MSFENNKETSFSLSGIYAINNEHKGRSFSPHPFRTLRTSACRGARVALQQSPILRTGTRNATTNKSHIHARSTNHPAFLRGFPPEATNQPSSGFLREAIRAAKREGLKASRFEISPAISTALHFVPTKKYFA
jgi:hypothetical protein